MKKHKVLVISSVIPQPTSSGQIVLYRHLCNEESLEVSVFTPPRLTSLWHRLRSTRLNLWLQPFHILWGSREWDKPATKALNNFRPDSIFTVAHGDGYWVAKRIAQKCKVPLVTIFHDWWPDIPALPLWSRRMIERSFHQLYKASTIAFCVCQGMKAELGSHNYAPILFPIPEQVSKESNSQTDLTIRSVSYPFRLLYSGNLYDYGDMLYRALDEFKYCPDIRLEVRGNEPNWPIEFKNEMRMARLLLEFAPRIELNNWLASADAYLIPMEFNPSMRRRMMTSFPSKLVEYAQFGKPLIIWGPDYCSAVQWAKESNAAICVTNPDPNALAAMIKELITSTAIQTNLVERIKEVSATDFNPLQIQAQFLQSLSLLI